MNKFLITGGLQRSNASILDEGHRMMKGRLLELNFDDKNCKTLLDYPGNLECYPDETPNILFTSASLQDGKLYLCTETEIFIYSYPSLELINRTSHPFFQNVHHVAPVLDYLAVASTGLDMVILLDKDTLEPVRFINPSGKDPWKRFSRSVDYRKIHSTKPHEIHPNFVFEINGEIWTTRFYQHDAVNIDDPQKRIDLGVDKVHDGHVIGDHVYFTTVNGCVVVANKHTLKIDDIIDLNKIDNISAPLGWCRGLAISNGIAYVGFSSLRRTAIKENVAWALDYVGAKSKQSTRISAYNLAERKKMDEYILPKNSSNVIYSILDPDTP
jgi:hypothetical protein